MDPGPEPPQGAPFLEDLERHSSLDDRSIAYPPPYGLLDGEFDEDPK